MEHQKNKTEKHIHHHWNLDKLFKSLFLLLVALILVSNICNWVTHDIQKDEMSYNKCVKACDSTGFGVDTYQKYDTTDCIQSCNDMYIKLKSLS